MKIKRPKREKEYSTQTLIDVNYEPDDVRDYDSGKAPVSRKTQYAEELEDLVEFQKRARSRDDMMNTHNYNVLNAVKEYDPDADKEPEEYFPETADVDVSEVSMVNDPEDTEQLADEFEEEENTIEVPEEVTDFSSIEDDIVQDYEPRPLRPDDAGYEDIMEQFTASPTKPNYWFEEFGDYWSCSCGHLNKGDYCTNCGLTRELLRSLFILHKPGEEPGEYEGMPVKYEEVIVPKGRLSSRAKLIIAIAIIAILLACGGFFTYYYMVVPAMEKQAAENLKNTTEVIKANTAECLDETDTFFWNSYVAAGDNNFDAKHYDPAISWYTKAQQINNTTELKDKILEAKYQHVKAKQKEGGEKFERYLGELMGIGYKDVADIYNTYYAWHFKIIANLSADDFSNDISTASRADIIYFHVSVSGGPPDGTISAYYETTWPSGSKQTDMIGSNWTNGSKGSARFGYAIPMLSKEGTLKFNLYDKTTNELLGSDSVEIKK